MLHGGGSCCGPHEHPRGAHFRISACKRSRSFAAGPNHSPGCQRRLCHAPIHLLSHGSEVVLDPALNLHRRGDSLSGARSRSIRMLWQMGANQHGAIAHHRDNAISRGHPAKVAWWHVPCTLCIADCTLCNVRRTVTVTVTVSKHVGSQGICWIIL